MELRQLGRTGRDVSVIGLGMEHLSRDRKTMDAVLQTAVDRGVNYIDLLYADPTGRDATFFDAVAPALAKYRERLIVAAHWGDWSHYELEFSQRCFDELLPYLADDHADIALLTMVDDERTWREWAVPSIERLRRYQESGKVGHIGMSCHVPEIALQAIRSGLIDVLMFSVNLLEPAGANRPLYTACSDFGVGLVAMKVYHGGKLLAKDGLPTGITPAQCLAYVLSLPVSTTVPGPKDLAEWRATLDSFSSGAGVEQAQQVSEEMRKLYEGQCVYCQHCLPCPEVVEIGWTIWHVDNASTGVTAELKQSYAELSAGAYACNECGVCLSRCPFGVDIIDAMRRANELFM